MSEENVRIVREMAAAARRGDIEDNLELYAKDAILDQSRMLGGGLYRGPEGVRKFYTEWFGAWENLEFEPERLIASEDAVILVTRMRGRGRESGVDVDIRAVDVFEFANGKIVRHTGYPDAAEALREHGVE